MKKRKISSALLFVICTYFAFWVALLITIVFMVAGADKNLVTILHMLSAFTPLFVFMVLFHRILPEETSIKEYIKKMFAVKQIGKMSAVIILTQSAVFLLCMYLVSVIEDKMIGNLIQISVPSFFLMIIYQLYGPIGEEMGWRGFVHFELTGKYGIIKGSVLLGIIWSFWHWPLWFVTSGYTGWKLLFYIISFIVSNVSVAVIIGICFDRKTSIFIPVLIHYMFNFTACFYTGDRLILLLLLAFCYFAGAVVMAMVYKKIWIKNNEYKENYDGV